MRAPSLLKLGGFYLWLGFIILWMVFPFYYAIVTSFQSGTDLFRPTLLPPSPTLENYALLFGPRNFGANILNSLIVSSTVVLIALTVSVFASFTLARVNFRGRKLTLLAILAVSMFPQVAVLAGMYELYSGARIAVRDGLGVAWSREWSLGWLSFSYMIFTLPFTVWTITAYMRALPKELEEAAIIDGASYFQLVYLIFLPLLWPAVVTTSLIAFVATWNEFLFALTFTSHASERTVTVAIAMITGIAEFQVPWGAIMAASVVVTLPIIILVLIFQRRLISGLTAGAVKG